MKLRGGLTKQAKKSCEGKGISPERFYTVTIRVEVSSGVFCLLKGTGYYLYEEMLEDVYLSNLDKILT